MWVGDAGMASGRRHQNLVPAGPKVDLPLAKAELNSKSSSTSIIIHIRKGKKWPHNSRKIGVKKCERNSPTDTQISEEGEGGVAPGADSPAVHDADHGEAGWPNEVPGGPWHSRDPPHRLQRTNCQSR